ncbi:hypothetical protein MBANPS3_003597 [Mucor bainieri]
MNSNNRFCALTLKESLMEQDKQHSPSLSTSSSLSSIESSQQHQNDCDSPHQFLYIVDSQTKSVLLSWPDHYHNEIVGSADYLISSLDGRPMLPGISCFRCVQQPSRISSSGQRLSSLIVEYGSITFLLVSLEKKKNKMQLFNIPPLSVQAQLSISTKPVSLPCSPNKYNQLDEYPLRRTSEPYTTTSNHNSPSHIHYLKPRKYQPYPTIPLENLLLPTNSDKQQQYLNSHHPKHHCQSCGTDSSPEWRRGPTGHKTLCNACGLRYSRSVARQGKMAANQQKHHQLQQHQHQHQQQHSLFQMPNTPQHQPCSSITTSNTLSYY